MISSSLFKFLPTKLAHLKPLSTLPSVSEAVEALEHIVDEDRKLKTITAEESLAKKQLLRPTLDRNRNKQPSVTYSIVGPHKVDVVNNLLYASYHPDEPITKHLGLYKGHGSIPDADRVVQEILPRNLSLFAYDKSGDVIGVCVNNACLRSEFIQEWDQRLEQVIDPSYKPMLAIHHQLRLKNVHVYDELKTERFFSIRMVGVDPKTRGLGVATDLIRRSILLAGCLGFSGVKSEATGAYSQKALATIGMLRTDSILYEEFQFEEKNVFKGMDPNHTELAFMKKKFFQSCLMHIM